MESNRGKGDANDEKCGCMFLCFDVFMCLYGIVYGRQHANTGCDTADSY